MLRSTCARSLSFVCSLPLIVPFVASAAEEGGAIEEIVVTATHRETNLMDTPQAISAINAELIDDLGVTDMQGLYQNISGLNMTEGAGTGQNRYTVRGVSSQTGTLSYAQTFAAVSVYLDDVPMTSAQGPARQFGGSLFDMDRVEVLKGPQGTLYGEGSVGGTIRFIQNKPRFGVNEWKVRGSANARDESGDLGHRLDGMVNVPLGENAALRLVGFTSKKSGWIDRPNLGQEDVNSETATGLRVAALWAPTDRLSVEGTIYTMDSETEGSMVAQSRYVEALHVPIPGLEPGNQDNADIFQFGVDYAFDFAQLETSFSYMDRESISLGETPLSTAASFDSFTQLNVLFRTAERPNELPTLLSEGWILLDPPDFATPANMTAFGRNDTAKSERSTFEAKLLSTTSGPWSWTAGLFWKDSDDLRRNFQPFSLIPSLQDSGPVNALYSEIFSDPSNDHLDTLNEISVFGEATYQINDMLNVTVGGRWTDMEQTLQGSNAGTADQVFSPKFGIAWYPAENTLTYFNVTTGFRPGNINLGQEFNARQLAGAGDNVIPGNPFAANPDGLTGNEAAAIAQSRVAYSGDEVTNYELGIKTRLFDNRWNLTASLYYFDWQDTILTFQQQNLPTINKAYNDNAGAAHSQGLEVDLVANLTERLRLRVGGDINEAELDEQAQGIPAGSQLPNAPQWSTHTTLDYTMPIGMGDLAANFMVNHTRIAKQLAGLGDTDYLPQRYQTDLRIGLSGPNTNWSASLFARNVTNEDDVVLDCSGFGNPVCFIFKEPRVIGLEFTIQQ